MVKAFALGDVGGFQEFSDLEDRQTLMRLAHRARLRLVHAGHRRRRDPIPIVWNRTRFRLIDGQTDQGARRRWTT